MAISNTEQLLLELINDARLDPMGNAARYISGYTPLTSPNSEIASALKAFEVNGGVLQQQFSSLASTQPLAFSQQLQTAALGHNQAMIAADSQSHQVAGESGLGARLSATGYALRSGAENVYAYGSADPYYNHAAFMVDWGVTDTGIQAGAGHRANIMNATLREIGISAVAETNPATNVGPMVVTEDFGSRGNTGALVLGVAYRDADANQFYSLGEGQDGLTVSLGGIQAVSGASGGYTLETTTLGRQTITLTGAGIAGAITFTTTLSDGLNAKLDVVNGNTLQTSVSGAVSGAAAIIKALGVKGLDLTIGDGDHQVYGSGGNDTLRLGSGTNSIFGGAGDDTLVFNFAKSGATISHDAAGLHVSSAGVSALITGVEHFVFNDGQFDTLADQSPVTVPTGGGTAIGQGLVSHVYVSNGGTGLVDSAWYFAHNPDVKASGMTAEAHYMQYGWKEGRDPSAFFSTKGYLDNNADVKAAGINPLTHYAEHGWKEGRDPSLTFDTKAYLDHNGDVGTSGMNPLAHYMKYGIVEGRAEYSDDAWHFVTSPTTSAGVTPPPATGGTVFGAPSDIKAHGFDAAYYLANNADVKAAGLDPLAHFNQYGWHEGRNPNAVFDTKGYLDAYGDVKAAGINPLDHYDTSGWKEGRDPSAGFDTGDYLAHYGDVANAHLDPMLHYLTNGHAEGRSTFADGHFG